MLPHAGPSTQENHASLHCKALKGILVPADFWMDSIRSRHRRRCIAEPVPSGQGARQLQRQHQDRLDRLHLRAGFRVAHRSGWAVPVQTERFALWRGYFFGKPKNIRPVRTQGGSEHRVPGGCDQRRRCGFLCHPGVHSNCQFARHPRRLWTGQIHHGHPHQQGDQQVLCGR